MSLRPPEKLRESLEFREVKYAPGATSKRFGGCTVFPKICSKWARDTILSQLKMNVRGVISAVNVMIPSRIAWRLDRRCKYGQAYDGAGLFALHRIRG